MTTTVTINLLCYNNLGDYESNGENCDLAYFISNPDWSGATSTYYPFIMGSGSAPAYFSSLAAAQTYLDAQAWMDILGYLNGNTNIPAGQYTFVQGTLTRMSNVLENQNTNLDQIAAISGPISADVITLISEPNFASIKSALAISHSDISDFGTAVSSAISGLGYVAQINADWNASSGLAKILNKPTISTAVSSLTNDSGYITTSALSSYVTSSSLTSTLGSYATSSALSSGLSGKQATITTGSSSQYFKGDLTLGTLASVATSGSYSDLSSKPTINNTTVYSGTTAKANPVFYTGSVTVGSGVAVFNITSDGTSTGTALFPNGPITSSLNFYVNDATAAYQMSAAWSNSNKTLTITANKLTTANLLSGILGQSAANGAVVNVSVWGN